MRCINLKYLPLIARIMVNIRVGNIILNAIDAKKGWKRNALNLYSKNLCQFQRKENKPTPH
jgi:hypothetical protein